MHSRSFLGYFLFLGILWIGRDLTWSQSPSELSNFQRHWSDRSDGSTAALKQYFANETQYLESGWESWLDSIDDWETRQPVLRQQLAEMLGLHPSPPRGDLQAEVMGTRQEDDFIVERLVFQSLPGVYVTGNLYLPKQVTDKLPAILYLCGHAQVKEGDVSFGNKVGYHHHGVWFARNGYACLMIDTIQLGEIQGVHHGTHRLGQWWWNSRGYTPAGVETWNGMRAIDYLITRPEIDPGRIGVTGRSGGGAYSWYVAALDPRVAVAAPVAGITNLRDHVVRDCVEGHCDCMFPINTYRWDFPQVAALIAPRPLLIANTDRDPIFPLTGVMDVHDKVRQVYQRLGATDRLGLTISPGGHADSQELQVAAFRWFDRHLGNREAPVDLNASKRFLPRELRVLETLPADERVTSVQEFFVPPTEPGVLPWRLLAEHGGTGQQTATPTWQELAMAADRLEQILHVQTFGGWPSGSRVSAASPEVLWTVQTNAQQFSEMVFTSQEHVELSLIWRQPRALKADTSGPVAIRFHLLDDEQWQRFREWLPNQFTRTSESNEQGTDRVIESDWMAEPQEGTVDVFFSPRGVGRNSWTASDGGGANPVHRRRRFMLLGQTLGGMQVWDIRRAMSVVQDQFPTGDRTFALYGRGGLGGLLLFAALGRTDTSRLVLVDPPVDHRQAIDLLNVARWVEPVHMASLLNSQGTGLSIRMSDSDTSGWEAYARIRGSIEGQVPNAVGGFELE